MVRIIAGLLVLGWGVAGAQVASALKDFGRVVPVHLRCDYAENPLGVDSSPPRLFWKLESDQRGELQTAYQILAASSATTLARNSGDLWDSGRVRSDETLQIPYAGKMLRSSQEVFWKVRVWDKSRKVSDWSRPASWTMGLLSRADWQAKWIGSPADCETLLLRRNFEVRPGLRRALLHVCGLGQYELTLNGAKAGDDLLAPGWSKYNKTCLYDTRDVTSQLQEGPNAVGLFLGNGMYNVKPGRYTKFTGTFGPLEAIAHLRLEYADGRTEFIGTDEQWRVAPGPITFCSIYGGEDYDARLTLDGWDRAGFDSTAWSPARIMPGPGGKLSGLSCAAPPLRAFEVLQPVQARPISSDTTVYDLGQNAPIMARIRVKGPAGSRVRIIPAELVQSNGAADRGSVGGKTAWWQYTLAGHGDEAWFSRFFYHGCRYLQVERVAAEDGGELPVVESIEGVVVHSSSAPVGEFACSDDLFNRIYTLIRWAQRANIVSVLTDCPHRERLGWLEQYHLNGPSLRYNFDLAQLFTKGMNDMADSQLADGLVPSIAPEYPVFGGAFRDSPEWGSAFVLVPWQQYQFTGDPDLLRRYYDGMKRYVAYLGSKARADIVSYGLGDWYDIGPRPPGPAQLTPSSLTATAFYFYDTWILSQTAGMLGETDEAKQFTGQANEIRAAFNREFFDPARKSYATGSQCANAVPLVMELADPENRVAVLDAIVADVRQHGNAITAGDVGYRYLLRALADGGRSDVIFEMNNQSDKPGYGYQLKMGATSLTEAWNAERSSSQNHFMLGQINEWFFHDLAGIAPDPSAPGFKKIVIHPAMVGNLNWVKAKYDSIRGLITTEWKRDVEGITLDVAIPPSTTATVFLPAQSVDQVRESGVMAATSRGVKFLRLEKGVVMFEIVSGKYRFKVR
jgi:hypothetical protein